MDKIKFIKNTEKFKLGDIAEANKKSAESYVKNGYAEYFEEPIIKKEEKIFVNISALNYNKLKKKYPAFNLDKFVENKCEYYRKKPFEEREKKIWIKEIGEFLILVNEDFQEKEEVTEEPKEEVEEEQKAFSIEGVDKKLEEGDNQRFFNIFYSEETGEEIGRKVNVEFTSNYLTTKYDFKTLYGEKTEKIKLYDGKIYGKNARGLIKSLCESILKSYAKKQVIEEIFDKVKRKTKTTEEEFDKTDLYLIPLENGCYNIKTKELEEHKPENNFTFYSPIKFVPHAQCPVWFKFIEEALYPEDVKLMQQWFGFNLFRQYFIKKALILLGKKDTGKTIILDTLIHFVGEKNKCGLSLHKITTGSDFTKFALKGKLSNIYDDLSSADINDGGAFKLATGGGYISAEEKFGEFVQFKTFAKISLAGNKAPPVKDNDDDAYFSRYLPTICDNVPEKIDPFLRDKIQTEEEMSGILNWGLKGLHEILKSGNFNFNKSDEEIKKIMEMSGDILIQFGEEVLEQSEEQISKDDMYKVYCIWANENDKPLLSKEQLGRRLNQKVKYLVPKNDAKKRYWDNVKINNNWVEKINKFNLKGNQDTLDTFSNNMRNYNNKDNNDSKISNIKLGEVSNPSNEICSKCNKKAVIFNSSGKFCSEHYLLIQNNEDKIK